MYEIPSGKVLAAFSGHLSIVYDLCWSRDDHSLMSASSDGTVRYVWRGRGGGERGGEGVEEGEKRAREGREEGKRRMRQGSKANKEREEGKEGGREKRGRAKEVMNSYCHTVTALLEGVCALDILSRFLV